MRQNHFFDVQVLLGSIRGAVGDCGLVGAAWDGDLLRVTHAIPESGKQVFVMTFDDPVVDYAVLTGRLIEEFAKGSAAHFASEGGAPEETTEAAMLDIADYIECMNPEIGRLRSIDAARWVMDRLSIAPSSDDEAAA